MVAASAQTQQLRALKATLQGLDREGKRALGKTLSAAVDPLRDDFKAEVATKWPKSGGFAAYVGRSRFAVRRRLGGSRPTLAIRVSLTKSGRKGDLARMDAKGRLRHPVFGNRSKWANNPPITTGIWDSVTGRMLDETARNLSDAVDDAIGKVQ